jgi:hypothetical protein
MADSATGSNSVENRFGSDFGSVVAPATENAFGSAPGLAQGWHPTTPS